jgi:hypothetical protein
MGVRAAPSGAIENLDEEKVLEASGFRRLAAWELLDGFSSEELALSGEHKLVEMKTRRKW